MARTTLIAAAAASLLGVAIGGAVIAQNAQTAPAPAAPVQLAPATPATAPGAPAAKAAAKPAAPASTAAPAALAKPLWASLSPPQKTALAPLSGEWDRMDATRKQKWLEIANRFAAMKPDEQARVHEKMREWVKMTPDERRLVRENYTKAKKLDTTVKSEQWEKYQQLPEEEKQKLAADAVKKKQVTNLPPPTRASVNTVPPIKTPASAAVTSPAAPAAAPANAK